MAQAPARRPQTQQSGSVPVAGMEGSVFQIREFRGLNTKSDRTGIDNEEFSWLENLFPIAPATLRSLPSNGTTLLTAVAKTIVYFLPFNIGATQLIAVFYSDGTADQVDMNGVKTIISSAANTFYNGGDLPDAVQWAASGLVIVTTAQTNGYFAWDLAGGGTLYKPFGSTGSGAPNTVTNAPSWLSGLATPLTFTGNTHSNTTVDTLVPNTTGVVGGMQITGTDIPAGTTVVTFTATTITLSQAATGTHAGTFTVQWAMPTGIQGTGVEIFQSRTWVDNNQTKFFSAPANGANFAGAQGGGAITATDNFLRVKFILSKQASSFLYSFGDSSINVISNVQSTGSPIVTTFNNQNVDPQVGSPWPGTIHAFGRGLVFANPAGVFALYGGAAEKVSGALDGIFATADFTFTPTGGVAIVYGVKVYTLLMKATDYLGNVRVMMFVWDGQKWFVASQDNALTYIESQEINSVLTLWGTDGTNLFRCFNTASATLTKILQTKLFEGQTYIIIKQLLRVFALGQSKTNNPYLLTGTIDMISDTGAFASAISLNSLSSGILWLNNLNQTVIWVNNLTQVVTFGGQALQLTGQNASGSAALMGLTLTSSSQDFVINAVTMLYRSQAPIGG